MRQIIYQKKIQTNIFSGENKKYYLRINSTIKKIRSNKELNNENSMARAKCEYVLKPNTHTVSFKHVDNPI